MYDYLYQRTERLEADRVRLLGSLDAMLVEVEALRAMRREWVERQVAEARANAERCRGDREPWVFSSEYRASLMRDHVDPLDRAVREANATWDEINARVQAEAEAVAATG